jgi:hypothetical protein
VCIESQFKGDDGYYAAHAIRLIPIFMHEIDQKMKKKKKSMLMKKMMKSH